jgi:hypothetical protein
VLINVYSSTSEKVRPTTSDAPGDARGRGSGGLGDRMQAAPPGTQEASTATTRVSSDDDARASRKLLHHPYGLCTPRRSSASLALASVRLSPPIRRARGFLGSSRTRIMPATLCRAWDGTLDSARSSRPPQLSGLQNHSVARAKQLAPHLLRKSRRQTAKVSGLTESRMQTTPGQRVTQSRIQLSATDAVPSQPTAGRSPIGRTATTKENR